MTRYNYYAVDTNRQELAAGTVTAEDIDAAIRAATAALEHDVEYADIEIEAA
jgi:hypothetical protein